MQTERQKHSKVSLPTFFDLDVIGAAGAVIVFLGVTAKAMIGWLIS